MEAADVGHEPLVPGPHLAHSASLMDASVVAAEPAIEGEPETLGVQRMDAGPTGEKTKWDLTMLLCILKEFLLKNQTTTPRSQDCYIKPD